MTHISSSSSKGDTGVVHPVMWYKRKTAWVGRMN